MSIQINNRRKLFSYLEVSATGISKDEFIDNLAKDILEKRYGKENVLSERYLRDNKGKSVKDPLTGERRRIDFVVKG